PAPGPARLPERVAPPVSASPPTVAIPRVSRPSAASPYVQRLSPYMSEEPSTTPTGGSESVDPEAEVTPDRESAPHADAPAGPSAHEEAAPNAAPPPAAEPPPSTAPPPAAAPPEPYPVVAPPTSSPIAPPPDFGSGSRESLGLGPARSGPLFAPPLPSAPPAPASAAAGEAAQQPASPTVAAPPAAGHTSFDPGIDDDEHTVVVSRRRESWVLEVEGGATYGLGGQSVVIGRATAAAIPGRLGVVDPTRTVSKLHAELEPRDGGWWVRDLGSTNGTYIRAADGTEREVPDDGAAVDGSLLLGDLVARIVAVEEFR
ncbi:MAG: FHA domain-containing protein, partial [Demequina sp.]